MQFPNNEQAELTERIMAEVKKRLPDIDVHHYNRTFEAVYHVLTEESVAEGVRKLEDRYGL